MAKDRHFPDLNPQASDAVIGLASPKDRLAAYILDCTLLLPLVQLLQSPFKRWILESFLFDEGAGVSTYRILNLVIFISLFIIYYTVMIAWRGQTLGKMFFGLRVISYNGPFSWLQAFLRSVFIFFEFVSFGIPLLAIFSHPMRRPMHDRVADTLVISDKNPASYPSKFERWSARWATGAFTFILGVFVITYALIDGAPLPGDLADLEACEAQVEQVGVNLEAIVELHVANQISDDCLFEQAREGVWGTEDRALAQFAMALALREDPEQSRSYVDSLCEENSNHHLCDLSLWTWEESTFNPKTFKQLLSKLEDKSPYPFVRVYLAALLNNEKRYQQAEQLLDPIEEPGRLQPVVAALTFHSLLGQLKWEEAYWVAKTQNAVSDPSLLYFMQMELKRSRMSTKQQIQLLDYFYPGLGERSSRAPASLQSIPTEIRDIYRILEGRL